MLQASYGLTSNEVAKKTSLGLTNDVIDSYSPSIKKIFLKNIFCVINVVVIPLLVFMGIFGLYMELTAMGMFILINTITSIIDEIRIKKEVEKLKSQFAHKVTVIRDNIETIITLDKIVLSDVIKTKEGELVVADGKILEANYLQIDESALTGETDYISKSKNEKIFSGSIVITGACYYEVTSIGQENMANKLASTATKITVKKSILQQNADKLILFLIISAICLGLINYLLIRSTGNYSIPEQILSVATITSLIIPQTLIFLFTLTFSISISKLFTKGVLVQKGASIETLSHVDMMCFDKTGTITTNQMKVRQVEYTFSQNKEKFGSFFNSSKNKIFGINKTSSVIFDYFSNCKAEEISNLKQIPFTSKNKFSAIEGKIEQHYYQIFLGALEVLKPRISPETIKKINKLLHINVSDTARVVVAACYQSNNDTPLENFSELTDKVIVFFIEEELNYGIKDIFHKLKGQGIAIKIISGDNASSVGNVIEKVGLSENKIYDLSLQKNHNYNNLVYEYNVFTRATPEDKINIVNALKEAKYTVAMVGDGVNDCLGLKGANVSIAMEHGASVTRDISDIILLNNDFKKLPEVFYEGDNIIFNLKLSTKLFLTKSLFAVFLGIFFSLTFSTLPMHPSSILVFSFLSSSLPSYILIFTRDKINNGKHFFREIFLSSIPASIVVFWSCLSAYYLFTQSGINYNTINTALVLLVLTLNLIYCLIILAESNRIKSFLIAILFFVIAFTLGFLQTFLPIESNDSILTKTIIISLFTIASINLYIFAFSKIKPINVLQKGIKYIGPIIWWPIALIFPFRTYYHLERLNLEVLLIIFIYTVIGGLLMYLISKFSKQVIK